MKTAVIVGASQDRSKFGNISLRAHRDRGYRVYGVHPSLKLIEGSPVFRSISEVPGPIDRLSVYLPPKITLSILPEIAACHAHEVWFNPGAEDEKVRAEAERLGIAAIYGCSIIDIGASPGDYQ